MNFSQEEVSSMIGFLYMENVWMRKQIIALEAQLKNQGEALAAAQGDTK